MSTISEQAGVPGTALDQLEHLPKRRVMVPVHALASVISHPEVHFEDGAEPELHEHRDAGGGLLLLATHFSRWDPITLASAFQTEKSLRHLRFNTGVTARKALFELPVAGYIVRNSGAQMVDRQAENTSETARQREARTAANIQTQTAGARYLAHGLHWLIFPEGSSRKITKVNGETIKEPRKPGELLPIRRGFILTLEALSPEEREQVKLLGIVAHYGERRFASLRPTVHISRPVTPLWDDAKQMRQQGRELLQRGLDEAMRLDALRRR